MPRIFSLSHPQGPGRGYSLSARADLELCNMLISCFQVKSEIVSYILARIGSSKCIAGNKTKLDDGDLCKYDSHPSLAVSAVGPDLICIYTPIREFSFSTKFLRFFSLSSGWCGVERNPSKLALYLSLTPVAFSGPKSYCFSVLFWAEFLIKFRFFLHFPLHLRTRSGLDMYIRARTATQFTLRRLDRYFKICMPIKQACDARRLRVAAYRLDS